MKTLLLFSFWMMALINILPALSGFSTARLSALYGIESGDAALMTLLQHRALLFGLVAAACVYAVFMPSVRWLVLIGTAISMGGFIVVAALHGTMSGALQKIVIVDAIGCVFAAIAAVLLLKGF